MIVAHSHLLWFWKNSFQAHVIWRSSKNVIAVNIVLQLLLKWHSVRDLVKISLLPDVVDVGQPVIHDMHKLPCRIKDQHAPSRA